MTTRALVVLCATVIAVALSLKCRIQTRIQDQDTFRIESMECKSDACFRIRDEKYEVATCANNCAAEIKQRTCAEGAENCCCDTDDCNGVGGVAYHLTAAVAVMIVALAR